MISILIITYGRYKEFLDTLACINKYTGDKIELLILDNNSTNNLEKEITQILNSQDIILRYFNDGHNYGVSEGRNYLINKSQGQILVTLDDDIEIENMSELLFKIQSYFLEYPNVGALAFNIKNFYSRSNLRHEIPHGNKGLDFNNNLFTYYYIGAGHAIRKSVYDKVGLYPTDLGKYGGEERDLSFRILENGYDILYTSDIIIFHKVSPDGRMKKTEENFYRYRNQLIVLNRYMPLRYRLTSNIFWSIFYLLRMNGNITNIYRVIREIRKIKRETISSSTVNKIIQLKGRVFY